MSPRACGAAHGWQTVQYAFLPSDVSVLYLRACRAQVQPRLCYVLLAMNLAVYAAGVGIAVTQARTC